MDKRRSFANCNSTDHRVSACPNYKQGMKAIGFSLEDEDASKIDLEDFMRGVIAKFGPRCFFCNLEGPFESDCRCSRHQASKARGSFIESESHQGSPIK